MALSIVDYISTDLYNHPQAPQLMRTKVVEGNLGAKTGKGFYDWSKKDIEAVKQRRDNRDNFVLDFLQRWR